MCPSPYHLKGWNLFDANWILSHLKVLGTICFVQTTFPLPQNKLLFYEVFRIKVSYMVWITAKTIYLCNFFLKCTISTTSCDLQTSEWMNQMGAYDTVSAF